MNAFTPGEFTITPPRADTQYRKNGLQPPTRLKGAIDVVNQENGRADAHRRDSIKRGIASKETK
jgi:hypothetical protein